ncbi:MAG TPA: hypothetical protein VJW20_03740 [Candidatus Angelobacter sp.]|nr:hypothetical protein [Candidatus Angelobacter sp.]
MGWRILAGSFILTVLAAGIPACALPPLQAGHGQPAQGRNNNSQTQRNQQFDRQRQLQQELQADQLRQFGSEMQQNEAERARHQELLRANFRHHYAVIRKNAEELVQLTSSLQSDLENNGNAALTRDTIDKTKRMQKLAHEILDNMAGRKLPKPQAPRSTASSTGPAGIGIADHEQLLKGKTRNAKSVAAQVEKAVENYLANDNEQAVSVSALQGASDKKHLDPNLAIVVNGTIMLQQLADEIRSEMRKVSALR